MPPPTGAVIDPLGGLADAAGAAGAVHRGRRGADRARTTLRILRFFRFHAWYGDPAAGIDADGLAACAAGVDRLDGLSRERVGAEMRKLLAAPDPAPAMAALPPPAGWRGCCPGPMRGRWRRWWRSRPRPGWCPMRCGGWRRWAARAARRLRLSRADARRLRDVAAALGRGEAAAVTGYRYGAGVAVMPG